MRNGLPLLFLPLLLLAADAGAAEMGHGTFVLDVVVSGSDTDVCQYITFPDQDYDVFGTTINLSEFGDGVVCFASTVGGVPQPTTCRSHPDPSIWQSTSEAETRCLNPPSCTHTTFVAIAEEVTGSLPASLGSSITYTADGEQDFNSVIGSSTIPGCTLSGTVYRFTGDISVNAFQNAAVGEGAAQQASFDAVSFYNPLTNGVVTMDVDLRFSAVLEAGTASVAAVSTASETIPTNFAVSFGGYQSSFVEISTTAVVEGPVEVCLSYPDADDDGFLDGTSPPVPESALSLMHGEAGTFVDRTTLRDADDNFLCGTTDHLSPFAVMVRTSGLCPAEGAGCDDGNACTTVDTCDASLQCVGSGPEPDCDDGDICTNDVCVAPGGCTHPPHVETTCNRSNTKASLLVKNADPDSKDSLKFSWSGGSSDLADFGSPASTTSYTLCASDASKLLVSAVAAAAATCGEVSCWTESEKGVRYLDKTKPGSHDGVAQLTGTPGVDGKSKLTLRIAGETMPPIQIGAVSYPVTVQVRTSAGACWEQQFSSTDAKKDDGSQLKLAHKAP